MKRCFIEVDPKVDEFDVEWIEDRIDCKWDEFFNITVTDANRLKPATWKAIKESDEIWYNSSFIGRSGELLIEMLEMGVNSGLINKKVINLHDSKTQAHSMAIDLMNKLSAENNIQFLFSDSPNYPLGLPDYMKNKPDY